MGKKIRTKLCLLVAALVFVLSPADALALSFSISMTPESPRPNETVFLSVSALEFNMDLSTISWSVDGKAATAGVGKKNFSVVAPANGKTMKIDVKVVPNIGGTAESSIVIAPAEIDLLWEATDSYVPPFYKGKALPITQSEVKVVAMPNIKSGGSLKSARSFVYTWQKDGKNIPNANGLGKSSYKFANQILEKSNRVSVSASDGASSVASAVTLDLFSPEIIFYETDRAGLVRYQEAYGVARNVPQSRLSLVAEPYFLSSNFKTNNDIKTVWKLNDQEVKPASKNNVVINAATTTGSVDVYFAYDDVRKMFRDFNKTVGLNVTR